MWFDAATDKSIIAASTSFLLEFPWMVSRALIAAFDKTMPILETAFVLLRVGAFCPKLL